MALTTLVIVPIHADQYDADRHQMKLMEIDILKKLNQQQFDAIMPYLDPKVIMTFYDARTASGITAVKSYMQKMISGPSPVLKSFEIKSNESAPATVFPNGTAIASGWTKNIFNFIAGNRMEVDGRWTVTMLKEGNSWKIIALHFSTNLFDNPLANAMKRYVLWLALVALIVGLLLGYITGLMRRKKTI